MIILTFESLKIGTLTYLIIIDIIKLFLIKLEPYKRWYWMGKALNWPTNWFGREFEYYNKWECWTSNNLKGIKKWQYEVVILK